MEFACQRSSCGAVSGILAVLYRIAIEYGTKNVVRYLRLFESAPHLYRIMDFRRASRRLVRSVVSST